MKLSRAYRIGLAFPSALFASCALALLSIPDKSLWGFVLFLTCGISAIASCVVAPAAAMTVLEARELHNRANWLRIALGAIPALLLIGTIVVGLINGSLL